MSLARSSAIIEHNGNLALRMGEPRADYRRPVTITAIWDSGVRFRDDHRYLLEARIEYIEGDIVGLYHTNGQRTRLDIAGWGKGAADIETPIPAPKDGATHTWIWRGGKWDKEEFPLCRDCYALHAPELPECEGCGYHHRGAAHVERKGFRLVRVKA